MFISHISTFQKYELKKMQMFAKTLRTESLYFSRNGDEVIKSLFEKNFRDCSCEDLKQFSFLKQPGFLVIENLYNINIEISNKPKHIELNKKKFFIVWNISC